MRVYGRTAELCRLGPASRIRGCPERRRERLVLSVGALAPHKGFEFLIRALATLAASDRPPLAIVSNYQDPEELTYLTELASALGVVVTFRCAVSERELAEWYARAGCFAYAPIREPFGLVVLEAMAAGVPIVAVAEGGPLDSVTPNVTGLLCAREAGEFGATILRVLSDDALAKRLVAHARRAVEHDWTWAHHEACLTGLLEQAIDCR
jgi:glycosyltransferase involved in cell wall biosynthesis